VDAEQDRFDTRLGDQVQHSSQSPEKIAYIIYTSGSTGRPKGVPITHVSLFNLICWHQHAYDVRPADRATQVAGPAFDASVWEIWPYLTAGASVHIPDNFTRSDVGRLVRWLVDQEITLTFLPTPLAESALRENWPDRTALRALLTGGDKLNQRPAQKLSFRIVNHYGPTENTVVSTCADVAENNSTAAPPIGRPLPNTQAYVVDRHLQLVPIGVPGELLLGGAQLTSGYWRRPEFTVERFIPNPFVTEPEGRLYRTGDLVRWLPDGNLEFLGRIDNQVKIRGLRIELGEIEFTLRQHPAVREVLVLAREEVRGKQRLVAYVVAENPSADLAEQLRALAQASLPQYMVPATFALLDAFPLTPNGKIDRRQLPPPENSTLQISYVTPRAPIEEIVANIWAEILSVERVGAENNFFDLGGNSLLAMQVVSKIREKLAVELSLRDLFVAPTVSQMTARIEALRAGAFAEMTAPPLEPSVACGPAETSFSQQRLWFLDQIEPGGAAYTIPAALELRGALDVSVLERALAALIARHESLRTVFINGGGQPLQLVSEPRPWTLPVIDLSSELEPRQRLKTLLREEAAQGFDLASGPLFRTQLYRLAPETYVLLMTMHHIISDGWSMTILIQELGDIYREFLRGQMPSLPAHRVQYRDFARGQRQWLQGEVLERLVSHWRKRLAGAPQVIELPVDRPRPPVESHRGALYSFTLNHELSEALRRFARREGATLYMTLLAGFTSLLSRYSGQKDLLVGTPVANRNRAEIENLVGFFVNTLVLRANFSGNPSVREFLAQIREASLDAFAHQDLPFDRLVEEIRPARDLSRSPLIQVIFAFQNVPTRPLNLPGLTQAPLLVDAGAARVDLTLHVEAAAGALSAVFEYATDLFDEATVARMAAHFQSLLQAMIATPERRVSELPLLTATERTQLMEQWNQSASSYPKELTFAQLFEAQVQRSPDAVALIIGQQQLSYAELNARANQLAHHLRWMGVGPESLVGICCERNLDMVSGMLGVLKAGGAYLPMDPNYPVDRLTFTLSDARASLLITQEKFKDRFSAETQKLCLDTLDLSRESTADPSALSQPSDLAYVIYTSGSTGQPKGVALEHRSLNAFVHWAREQFTAEELDGVLAGTSICFDLSVFELLVPLCWGGKIILADNVLQLPDVPAASQVRLINTVPSAAAELLRINGIPAGVRVANLAGEPLRQNLVDQLYELSTVKKVYDLYGPTEDTVYSTCALRIAHGRANIGRPLANKQIYILDEQMEPVPVGIIGELYIGGDGLARGYLNRRELTAERFLEHAGRRLYKTGDLGRYQPDGNIEFLGRADHQVKIRGFRIELGEIEAQLREHPVVQDAIVVARDDDGEKRLVAYVTTRNPSADLVKQLRALVRRTLPHYMLPAGFVLLDAFPLTANGKIDRNALPPPELVGSARSYEAPQGQIEIKLARIWSEALKIERVGRRDNFFDLGGHSLLAVGVIERMRREGLHADVRALFAAPTLTALAETVSGESETIDPPSNRIPVGCETIIPEMLPLVKLAPHHIEQIARAVPGGAANIQDIYPLGPLQEGILFHHLLAIDGDPYLLSVCLAFDSRARLDRYLEALQAIVDRHDVLRTAVLWEGLPEPAQVVWRQASIVIEEVTTKPGADAAEQLKAHFNPRHERLDIKQAPMLRIFIAHDAASGRWLMLQVFHHLSVDHTSLEIIQQEIHAHLRGEAARLSPPLPFRNFVAQARLGVPKEEHEGFFHKLLGDVNEPTVPFGLTDVQGDGSAIAEARSPLDAPLARRLRRGARALGVSAASIFHLAWAQVLARVSGRDDVVFGTLLFGRMQGGEGADRALGLFINTLPVRIRIGNDPVERSVRRTHALLAELLRHEHAPLALAQRCSAVRLPTPLFSALLNYRHSAPAPQSSTEGFNASEGIELLSSEARTNYPVFLAVDDLGEGFSLCAQVQSSIDPQRICAFMQVALEQLVTALESAPHTPLSDLDVLPTSERRQLLVDWNQTTTTYPRRELCLHELIEEQARRTPDHVALVFEQQTLTYRELDERANRLAGHLRKMGVAPDSLVGLFVERSIEMVVGLLGVLKAGAAYVPIDTTFPRERIAFLLSDAGITVLLTETSLIEDVPKSVSTICLNSFDWSNAQVSMPECARVSPENLAYVIYTSGSTGRPKGVCVEHRSIVNYVLGVVERLGLTPGLRYANVSTIAADLGHTIIFPALITGGCLHIISQDRLHSQAQLSEYFSREHIDVLKIVPSHLTALQTGQNPEKAMPKRCLILGGEASQLDWIAQLRALSPNCEIYNHYGPTETTVGALTYRVGEALPMTQTGTLPLGKPLANARIYILDEHGQPAPVAVEGELCVGGAGVARGYLNRPDLTADKFVPDPFKPGGRLYRTGDRARYLSDGNIEFCGRIDDQIKLRGYRIELGEIEEALREQHEVREVVVLARDGDSGDKQLIAYVVPNGKPTSLDDRANHSAVINHVDYKSNGSPAEIQNGVDMPLSGNGHVVTPAILRTHLQARLPTYMIPSAFILMEKFPLTANGKLDRKALPAPSPSSRVAQESARSYTRTEQALASICTEVLKVENVGLGDNFFDLGGHSLLAIKTLSRIRDVFEVDLPTRTLFEKPVISDLAEAIDALQWLEKSKEPACSGIREEIVL